MMEDAMNTFEDRKKSYEAKFAHDDELRFRAEARRNRLIGLWAADLLGKSGDDAAAYAGEVVNADLQKPGSEEVVRRLATDLAGKASMKEIEAKMSELLDTAKEQIAAEA